MPEPTARAWIEVAPLAHVTAFAADEAWLSPSESARLATLRHAGRRAQYLAGHWLARVLLARAGGGSATDWSLLERRGLPPTVVGHESHWHVSISHGGDWIAAAVADAPIGIDLEPRGRVLDASLEPLLLDGLAPGALDAESLLQRWVAKEAWSKRHAGSALPHALARLHLQPCEHEHADVRVDSHEAFHLGVSVVADCTVERFDDATAPGIAFQVLA